MTFPKKGTRKIVVDGVNYRWRSKTVEENTHVISHHEIVVELPDRKVFRRILSIEMSVTPQRVANAIRDHLETDDMPYLCGWGGLGLRGICNLPVKGFGYIVHSLSPLCREHLDELSKEEIFTEDEYLTSLVVNA